MDEAGQSSAFEPHRYLSAPWRMRYLREGVKSDDCVFCSKVDAGDDEANLVLWRGTSLFVMLNLYPYATGHLMVAPYAHAPSPEEIDPAIMEELGRIEVGASASLSLFDRTLSAIGIVTDGRLHLKHP